MNVLYWNVCSQRSSVEVYEDIVDTIAANQIDIACLQEVPYVIDQGIHNPVTDLVARDLGAKTIFEHTRTLYRTKNRINGYGTAILSLAGMLKPVSYVLRDDRFAYMTGHRDNQRVLMGTRTELEPHVQVSVAHLSYALPLGIGRRAMLKEQDCLAGLLAQQARNNEVVFGGDLNALPSSTVDEKLSDAGLYNVVDSSQPTFRSKHWYAGHTQRNLDRVYISADIGAITQIGESRGSDHNPVIVKVGA